MCQCQYCLFLHRLRVLCKHMHIEGILGRCSELISALSLRNMIRLRNHISSLICCLRCKKHNKYSIESYRFGLFDAIFPSPVAARMIFFQFSISSFLLWMFYSNGNSSPFSGFPMLKLESRENFKNLIEKFFCRCCCCCTGVKRNGKWEIIIHDGKLSIKK